MSSSFGADRTIVFSHGKRTEYPDGSYKIICCNRPVFRVPGWEDRFAEQEAARREQIDYYSLYTSKTQRDLQSLGWADKENKEPDPENIKRAARRAAARLRDIAMCNPFKWFVTLTLDQTKIDRYDIKVITKKLRTWLDNQVRRRGLVYALVPELHQDGAVHFHGFINDCGGMEPSGTWIIPGHKKPKRPRSQKQADSWRQMGPDSGYHEVFNWEAWPLGFTTAIQLYGDYNAAIGYVCKYITKQIKDAKGKIGGRWYYSGGDLREPVVTYPDYSYDDLLTWTPDAHTFDVPEARLLFAIYNESPCKIIKNETDFTKAGL